MIVIGLSVALFFCAFLVFACFIRMKHLDVEAVAQRKEIDLLRRQSAVLSNEASCCATLLGAEGAKLLSELDSIIEKEQGVLDDMMELASSKGNFNPNRLRAKQIVDKLTHGIIEASSRADEEGLPKIRKESPTLVNLSAVGLVRCLEEEESCG